MTVEELHGVVCREEDPDPTPLKARQQQAALLQAALVQLDARHQENTQQLRQLTNENLGRKDAYIEMLYSNVLGRGLEDLRLCTPDEKEALKDLLVYAESVTVRRDLQLEAEIENPSEQLQFH